MKTLGMQLYSRVTKPHHYHCEKQEAEVHLLYLQTSVSNLHLCLPLLPPPPPRGVNGVGQKKRACVHAVGYMGVQAFDLLPKPVPAALGLR